MSEKDCHCGCNHDHGIPPELDDLGLDEEELDVMYLTLDDDTELECYVLGVFECEEKEYIALLPKDDEAVILYKYAEVDGEIELGQIESDEEFDKVSKAFNAYSDEL